MKIVKVFVKILGFALAAAFAFFFTITVVIFANVGPSLVGELSPDDYPSADGKHICSVRISEGGVLTRRAVVAEVRGTWIIGKRTIYAVDHIDQAKVIWLDDRTVWINGVSLDIYRDKYVSEVDSLNDP